jgi:hypothetical protein
LTLFGRLSQLPKRWRAWVAWAAVLVLIILFFPFQSTTVPRWRVQIVDEAGAQVGGINVTEHWQHYLLESDGHEEMRQANATGVVDFPARTVRASIATRAIDFIINSFRGGAGAKVDPYGSLVVWGSRDHETAVAIYKPGTPTQTEVVVTRR